MDKTIQQASDTEAQDDIIVLGVASIETKGVEGIANEDMGFLPTVGMSDD